jgi:hypothetical protein
VSLSELLAAWESVLSLLRALRCVMMVQLCDSSKVEFGRKVTFDPAIVSYLFLASAIEFISRMRPRQDNYAQTVSILYQKSYMLNKWKYALLVRIQPTYLFVPSDVSMKTGTFKFNRHPSFIGFLLLSWLEID